MKQLIKSKIKNIKENMRGLTLQLVTRNGYDHILTSMKKFGNAILEEKSKNGRINQVWT
jgi:hypothetical protein